ncbi:MAG: 16S rRNA (guanine(527)-N(7))-methyltransferase RsmG [Halothece sp.]
MLWDNSLGWFPSPEQQQQFEQLYQQILAGNQKLNLTRITEPEAFWEKHLWDSLRGLTPLNLEPLARVSIIDIGTGAGFPGLPCAIALPNAQVTLLDSTRKKIAFLKTLITELGFSQVSAIAGRAENMGKHPLYHRQYDFALLRAVSSASTCAEYALPFLKPEGIGVLYRGRWSEEEEQALTQTLDQLGGEIYHIEAFSTPLSNSQRHCIYLKRVQP